VQGLPLGGHAAAGAIEIVGLVQRQLQPAQHAELPAVARMSGAHESGTIRISSLGSPKAAPVLGVGGQPIVEGRT
jgi:hypothetical protein